jgi:hypothetical protein
LIGRPLKIPGCSRLADPHVTDQKSMDQIHVTCFDELKDGESSFADFHTFVLTEIALFVCTLTLNWLKYDFFDEENRTGEFRDTCVTLYVVSL